MIGCLPTQAIAFEWKPGLIRTCNVQMELGTLRAAAVLSRTAVHSTVLHVHLADRQRAIAQHLFPHHHHHQRHHIHKVPAKISDNHRGRSLYYTVTNSNTSFSALILLVRPGD